MLNLEKEFGKESSNHSALNILNEINFMLQDAQYYFLENNNYELIATEEKYIIDLIKIETLSELFNKYQNSKKFLEKEQSMQNIATKIVFLFDAKTKNNQTEFLYEIIGEEKIINFCGKLHGYFRHTINDSRDKEAKEWSTFDDIKKEKIMKEIFLDILYYLGLLKNEGKLDSLLFN